MERFGPWNLERRLGAGGMAEAFLARRADGTGARVCVKRILPGLKDAPGFAAMFMDEIALTRSLRHDHVVSVIDSGDEDGVLWMAMEYVDGPSLAVVLAHLVEIGLLPTTGQALEIARQLALALDHAHTARGSDGQLLGLVHRDVSPQNILFSRWGVLKLSDFGIARAEERLARTAAGVMKGKLGYLAPEQITGDVVDHRADQFAAGIVLWEILCGRRLFRGPELQVLEAVIGSDVVAPSSLRKDLPAAIDALVGRMLRRAPGERFATMAAVVTAIDDLMVDETTSSRAIAPLVAIDEGGATMRIPRTRFSVDSAAAPVAQPARGTGVWAPLDAPPGQGVAPPDERTVEGDPVDLPTDAEATVPTPRQERPVLEAPSPFAEHSGVGARPWPASPARPPPQRAMVSSSKLTPVQGPAPKPQPPPSSSGAAPASSSPAPSSPLGTRWLIAATLGAAVVALCAGLGIGLHLGRQQVANSTATTAGATPVAPPTLLTQPPATTLPPAMTLPDPPANSASATGYGDTGGAALWQALLRSSDEPCVSRLVRLRTKMPEPLFLAQEAAAIERCGVVVFGAPPSAGTSNQDAEDLVSSSLAGGTKMSRPVTAGARRFDVARAADEAKSLMVRGEYPRAVTALREIVDRDDNDSRAHLYLGICYTKLRKNVWARAHYQRFLELQPTGVEADRVRKSLESL